MARSARVPRQGLDLSRPPPLRRRRIRIEAGAVVADTTVLITLARIRRLAVLAEVHDTVVIPRAVHRELALDTRRPGVTQLEGALRAGWLVVREVRARAPGPDHGAHPASEPLLDRMPELAPGLGPGEAEAITLAEELQSRLLLLDDEEARAVAAARGRPLARTVEVLLAAKRAGLIESVRAELRMCARAGYRIAPAVADSVLRAAGE